MSGSDRAPLEAHVAVGLPQRVSRAWIDHRCSFPVSMGAGPLGPDLVDLSCRTASVVGTGIDPVTSRFSGARSTN
jgi:hypothetical protein